MKRHLSAVLLFSAVAVASLHVQWLPEETIPQHGREGWEISSCSGDAWFYLQQAAGGPSIAPYKYRVLWPWAVGAVSRATHIPIPATWAWLNAACAVLAAFALCYMLEMEFGYRRESALLGGVLLLASYPMAHAMPYPLVDVPAVLFSILIFRAVLSRNLLAFLLFSGLGIATKEILVVAALMWFCTALPRLRPSDMLACLWPPAVFVGIRLALGGAALEVNYGLNPLAGEWPSYGTRLFTFWGAVHISAAMAAAFGPLWLGVFGIFKNRELRRQLPTVCAVITATILLSSRIGRPLGILAPFIIPGALAMIDARKLPRETRPRLTTGKTRRETHKEAGDETKGRKDANSALFNF